jgi:hypothetical protein
VNSAKQPLYWAETVALLYLVIPLLLFFAFFIRLEIAIPACALVAFLLYEMIRKTTWRVAHGFYLESVYLLFLAILWVWLSGGIQPLVLTQNGDWIKHNQIIDFLAEHNWPASAEFTHFGNLALRYYIGWHLIPSVIAKLSPQSLALATAIWSMLGVFLFFSLLRGILVTRAAIIVAPIVFILFGGADIIGTSITHYALGPTNHFEWWAGWAQYSSNTTALFWSPHQALSAWLAVILLMRCRHKRTLTPYCALLVSATLLWSPFAAIGIVPFAIALAVQHGTRTIAFDWRAVASTLLLALPIGLYLISGTAAIPHGFIWTAACTDGPCFTWPSYFLFLAIEIGIPLTILFARGEPEQGFLVAAASALCLIPLYKMGVFNDLVMRASLPSLAVLAILCGKLFSNLRPYPLAAAITVLLLAFPSVLGELSRGFLPEQTEPMANLTAVDETLRWWIDQTFAPQPIWVLR